VTGDQRRKAKMVNFGIIYGISAFGLAQRLHIGRGESKEIIEEYFRHYPDVWNYMEKMKESAREKGYVETLCKRKRYLPDINSRNVNVKNLAERNAINAPIQGSAADIIKLAMINVEKRFAREGFESKVILQVHDELVIDTTPSELDRVMRAVKEEMERVMDIGIPLTAECNYGKNWLEAH
jgi:DNA polymerase-1